MTAITRLFFSLFAILIATSVVAQAPKGRILDAASNEPLPFAAITIKGSHNGVYSDIDGYFSIKELKAQQTIQITVFGYKNQEATFSNQNPWIILMEPLVVEMNEVVIRPGVNPAERIIRATIKNKEHNDPESEIGFTYDSYNKLVITGDVDSSLTPLSEKYNKLDSTERKTIDFFTEQHLMLMESVTHRKFLPPHRSEETILATRVSGLQFPSFALLATEMQSFSFYGETVNVGSISYLSPIAYGAISKYTYIIEDTTYTGKDTVFEISYHPKKGKNFVGMKGRLFINTNGFALQNVLAEPAEEDPALAIRIQQQYEFYNNTKWFPRQLNSYFEFKQMKLGTVNSIGNSRSYIKNIQLDAPLRPGEFTPVTLQMLPDAMHRNDSIWDKYREHPLDAKELKTYHTIDSVGKAENLDRKMDNLQALLTGKWNIGKIAIDLDKVLRFNGYEGWRLGVGAHTNERFSKRFAVGGFYGYGFKDLHSKFGGDAVISLYRKRNLWVKALYEQEVYEMGGNQLDRVNLGGGSPLNNVYPLFVSRMDRREKKEVQLNGRVIGNLSLNVFANQQYILPFQNYSYTSTDSKEVSLYTHAFHVAETGVIARWAPGEKLARIGDREVRLGGRWPIVYFKFTQANSLVGPSDFSYQRFDALIEKKFKIKNVGDLSLSLVGGQVNPNLPLSLLYNARGSYDNFGIATPGAFETMRTNEFQHNQFVAFHLRHNFQSLLLKTDKFSPKLIIVHSMMIGKLQDRDRHSFSTQAAEKGYFESGFQVDGLMRSSFSSLGIGVYYRYGAYHLVGPNIDNFAIKLSSSFNF